MDFLGDELQSSTQLNDSYCTTDWLDIHRDGYNIKL